MEISIASSDNTMAFFAAATEESNRVQGENGHDALSTTSQSLLDLFFGLVRGLAPERLREMVSKVISTENVEDIKSLFVLMFQTRWCRGGKGEKKLFYELFSTLYSTHKALCLDLMELIPQYGYWKDFRLLNACMIAGEKVDQDFTDKVVSILSAQFQKDWSEYEHAKSEGRTPKLSLVAKFYTVQRKNKTKKTKAVTQKAKTDNALMEQVAFKLIDRMPTDPEKVKKAKSWAMGTLRKRLSALKSALNVPEVLMAANKWAEIEFSKVTSLCLERNTRAFLDEDKAGNRRHPQDETRASCRQHLIEQLTKGVKGAQSEPHKLVEKIFGQKTSSTVKAVTDSQWDTLQASIVKMIEERKKETGSNLDLSKALVMSDVSGSMSGTPMMVSIAFGILVSSICHKDFRDLVLTFDTFPTFHNLSGCKTFSEKVTSLAGAPWGGSTDFEKAMVLIADLIRNKNIPESEIPQSLIVVSDMQFNQATGSTDYYSHRRGTGWGTSFDNIKNLFKRLGEDLYGHPIDPPTIVFWNVRANTVGFPADAEDEGVSLISGYSPALLKFILSGELEEEVEVVDEETGETKTVKVKATPEETLKKVLTEKALDPVREVVNKHL